MVITTGITHSWNYLGKCERGKHSVNKKYTQEKLFHVQCSGSDGNEDLESRQNDSKGKLSQVIRRKQLAIQERIQGIGPNNLESILSSSKPTKKPNNLLEMLASCAFQGRGTVIAEIAPFPSGENVQSLIERCQKYISWGADAIVFCCDDDNNRNSELKEICRVIKVPVVQKDWILHPLQISDAIEAGASATQLVHAVLKKGTPSLFSFSQSLGLDTIVEVVNLKELEELEPFGIPLFGVNISVGLSLSIPGFRQSIAKSLIQNLPFGAASVVGVSTALEAEEMRAAGADGVIIRKEALQGRTKEEYQPIVAETLLVDVRDALTQD